jgi:tetratricopeptide (TPR) repeat protein
VLLAALGAGPSPLAADSILLTSGRVIEADHAWVEGEEIRYVRNDTIYALPRSLVARVEAAGGGPGLEDPDVRKSRERLAAGDAQEALRRARLALFREPRSVPALQALAAAQIALGDGARARDTAAEALAIEPGSPLSLELLGDALLEAGDFVGARERYRLAAEAAPQPRVHKKLEALAPLASSVSSARFHVRFDGAADEPLGLAVLNVLDEAWEDHERRLGFAADLPVTVVLQTATAFQDTTRAPGWAAAWNDGTIRVPVMGLARPTPGLVRVLRHEIAHSFVASRTGPNCPTWLQEGIAQWLEGGDPSREDAALATLARAARLPRIESLEAPFVGLSEADAQRAYAASLSVVAFVVRTRGEDGLRRLIAALATGLKAREALQAAIGLDYAGLQRNWERGLGSAGAAGGRTTGRP